MRHHQLPEKACAFSKVAPTRDGRRIPAMHLPTLFPGAGARFDKSYGRAGLLKMQLDLLRKSHVGGV
jgi:hypothetical protein